MSDNRQVVARFTCDGCGKQYRWKRELAGRRVKCAKCTLGALHPAPGELAFPSILFSAAIARKSRDDLTIIRHVRFLQQDGRDGTQSNRNTGIESNCYRGKEK